MEAQVAKLKRQVKKLKSSLYEREKHIVVEMLLLNSLLVHRSSVSTFTSAERLLRQSRYIEMISSVYRQAVLDALLNMGISFNTIVRVIDEKYAEGVELHGGSPAELEETVGDIELPF